MDDLKKILSFIFNKPDDDESKRKHSITMLAIYGAFLAIVIILIQVSPDSRDVDSNNNSDSNLKNDTELNSNNNDDNTSNKKSIKSNQYDINYGYVYKILFDGQLETYIGEKIDDKEKFSYINGDNISDYAIINDNYLILDNGSYHVTSEPDRLFKYCDVNKLFILLEKASYEIVDNKYVYRISNSDLANLYGDSIISNISDSNTIQLDVTYGELKAVYIDFSSYISSIIGESHTFSVDMQFSNVGKIEDFNINVD